MDAEWLTRPRQWTIGAIQRFILFIGPISSIFDYLTFFIMSYVFNPWPTRLGLLRCRRCTGCCWVI